MLKVKHQKLTNKSIVKFDEYIIVDCEYYGNEYKRKSIKNHVPLQVTAIHYKNHRLHGKSLNQFIIFDNAPTSSVLRAARAYSGQAKDFANECNERQAITKIRSWFKSKSHTIPIIIVGSDSAEMDRLFNFVNAEFKKFLQPSQKIKEFQVYTLSELIQMSFKQEFHTNETLGLNSFDDELEVIDPSFIRTGQTHNAYDDCVLTQMIYYHVIVDKTTRQFIRVALSLRKMTQQLDNNFSCLRDLEFLDKYNSTMNQYKELYDQMKQRQ